MVLEHRVKLTFYGGVNKVGGNKVFLEDFGYGVKIFLDFGINREEYSDCVRQCYNPDKLENFTEHKVLPSNEEVTVKNLYSKNFIFNHKKLNFRQKIRECEAKIDPPSDLDAILISHPHRDHYLGLSFVNRNIPIYTGVVTKRIIKASSKCSPPRIENFLYGLNWKTFRTGNTITLNKMEIFPVHVDHSIPGAYGFIICSSAGLIVYTGDFRMHGPMKYMTFDLIRKISEVRKKKGKIESDFMYSEGRVAALICEGTHIHKGAIESEKMVKRQLNQLFKPLSFDYLLVQYDRVNWDRFRTFVDISKKYDWKYIIDEKDAYYYYRLNRKAIYDTMKDPEVKSDKSVYIISQDHARYPWQRYIRKVFKQEEITNRILTLDDIKNMEGKFCIYITSFQDFERVKKHLPKELNGAFISSSVDPYSEEYRHKTKEISRELRKIGIPTYKIHASGHAKPHDIIKLVQEIKPERIMPIHTKFAEFFMKLFKNYDIKVILPNLKEPIEIVEF